MVFTFYNKNILIRVSLNSQCANDEENKEVVGVCRAAWWRAWATKSILSWSFFVFWKVLEKGFALILLFHRYIVINFKPVSKFDTNLYRVRGWRAASDDLARATHKTSERYMKINHSFWDVLPTNRVRRGKLKPSVALVPHQILTRCAKSDVGDSSLPYSKARSHLQPDKKWVNEPFGLEIMSCLSTVILTDSFGLDLPSHLFI